MEIKRLDENGKVRQEFYEYACECCRMGIEIFVPVDGYENLYEISNMGRIKSLARQIGSAPYTRNKPEKILILTYNPKGYKTITLCGNSKMNFTIHRLVGIHFIPNPENKPTVNHEDGIKINVMVTNLTWNTYSENNFHAFRTGLRVPPYSTLGKKGADSHSSKPVDQFDKNNNFIKHHCSITFAANELGIERTSISICLRGKIKSAGGFVWKYSLTA